MKPTDMFPRNYLRGQDLAKPILIQITGIRMVRMQAGPDKPKEDKYVMTFQNVSTGTAVPMRGVALADKDKTYGHGLILRRSLAEQINTALGVDDTDDWLQKRVVIFPKHMVVAKRPLTVLCARAPAPNGGPPPEAVTTVGQEGAEGEEEDEDGFEDHYGDGEEDDAEGEMND